MKNRDPKTETSTQQLHQVFGKPQPSMDKKDEIKSDTKAIPASELPKFLEDQLFSKMKKAEVKDEEIGKVLLTCLGLQDPESRKLSKEEIFKAFKEYYHKNYPEHYTEHYRHKEELIKKGNKEESATPIEDIFDTLPDIGSKPFLLAIALYTLPDSINLKVPKAAQLYDIFIDKWIDANKSIEAWESKANKYFGQEGTVDYNSVSCEFYDRIRSERDPGYIKESLKNCVDGIAAKMHERGITSFSRSELEMAGNKEIIEAFFDVLPIRKVENDKYEFFNPSLNNYFSTHKIYQEILEEAKPDIQQTHRKGIP